MTLIAPVAFRTHRGSSRDAPENSLDAIRKRKIEVHVWTVNHPDGMSCFINLGVDNIITDSPVKLVAVIRERATLNGVEKFLLMAADLLKR